MSGEFNTTDLLAHHEQASEDRAFTSVLHDHQQHLRNALDEVKVAQVTAATELRTPVVCGPVVALCGNGPVVATTNALDVTTYQGFLNIAQFAIERATEALAVIADRRVMTETYFRTGEGELCGPYTDRVEYERDMQDAGVSS